MAENENMELIPAEEAEESLQLSTQTMQPQIATMWNDTKLMSKAWRTADMLCKSTIIPESYRGKTGDCLIAIDMANRMGISPIMVMQSSQVVKGNFTWKGTACKAFIDGCGKFRNSEYVEVGERGSRDWGFYLQAVNKKTGNLVKGETVTWGMALDEGWVNKPGSKWKTMPGQMARYRAAAFFARAECPEVLMGCYVEGEAEDIHGYEEEKSTVKFELPKP